MEKWEKCDPIPRIQRYLIRKGILKEKDIPQLEEELKADVQRSVDIYEAKVQELGNDYLSMFDHMYAEMPPYLQEQRDAMEAELKE